MPSYLVIGMSAEEFWHGDARLAVAYREADVLRRDREYQAEWRAGMYVGRAIGACFAEEAAYPDQPLFSSGESRRMYEEAKERARIEKAKAAFEAVAERFNRRFAEGGGTDGGSDD